MAPPAEASTGIDKKHHRFLSNAHQDLASQAGRIVPDLKTIQELVQTAFNEGLVDDRRYLTENIIQVAASLPNTSNVRDRITDTFVRTLWDTLQHPPLSYLGDQFKYRTADGSYNNLMYPHLGAAGSHYARTVTPSHPRPAVLPDPALIFDTLLAREGPAKEHPSKISSNLFHLATVIIHDLFHTDERDGTRLKNSSYLDLGPLYGHNQDQQDQIRTFTDGLLKPDTFAEKRLLSQPPGVCALLVAFNRFHNWVVGELALINEAGRFSLPSMKSDDAGYADAQRKRDNDLFQTGRLITCGLYVNIILNDYLRTILNLNENPVDSDWKLDPRKSLEVFDKSGVPRGVGNQVSAKFNMIYRWHATINAQDEAWVNNLCRTIFGDGVDASTLSVADFLDGLRRYFRDCAPDSPSSWTFGGLKRQKDGRFADGDLVRLMQEGSDNVAGAFGARNTPKVMKAIEMLGIQQGREWGLATLNEFRAFFKLKPYSTFEEVNSDPSIAETLEGLYGHPDNIELYIGIQAEEAKKPFLPGSGLCPGFTISAAILSDAVALVRGDRFYTVDYSPANLTSFGFKVADSDFNVAGGGVMYKLLMKAFPGWYKANSVYALYPFTTPDKTREVMQKYRNIQDLDFGRPSYMQPPVAVATWVGVTKLLEDRERFRMPWVQRILQLTESDDILDGNTSTHDEPKRFKTECLEDSEETLKEVRKTYEGITTNLLREHSRRLGDAYQIDFVRDVANLAHAYFCARLFQFPLTEPDNTLPDAYTPRELSDAFWLLFGYMFLDLEPTKSSQNRAIAMKEAQRMNDIMARVVGTTKDNVVNRVLQALGRGTTRSSITSYGTQFIKRLLKEGKSIDDVVWTIIQAAATTCASQAQKWGHMVDLYLSDEYISHWPAIQELARSDAPEAFEKLKKYALEGFRLSPTFGILRTAVDKTVITDDSHRVTVEKDAIVFGDITAASRDASHFPDPLKIRLDRPVEACIHHECEIPNLGRTIEATAGAVLLQALGRLENVRRSPGPAGEIRSRVDGACRMYLQEDGSDWVPFPQNKKVIFDKFG